jgi:hypothetical protein
MRGFFSTEGTHDLLRRLARPTNKKKSNEMAIIQAETPLKRRRLYHMAFPNKETSYSTDDGVLVEFHTHFDVSASFRY